jgi:hypothetical protein
MGWTAHAGEICLDPRVNWQVSRCRHWRRLRS